MAENSGLNFGITPFWFWNGDMREDEIVRQVREMKEKGTAGFFIHPRQGLTVPYLSEEWFEKVGVAIEAAKQSRLDVWLYDEYPYPSGIAGGEVILRHPEYEAKKLDCEQLDAESGEAVELDLPWGNIISAVAYPLEGDDVDWSHPIDLHGAVGICRSEKIFQLSGLTAYNRKRFFEGRPYKRLTWRPNGRCRIFVFVETPIEHMKFYGRFVDPLIPGAVRCFIDTTHEQYRRHFGGEFGKTVKGVFSDEIDINPHGGKIRWSSILPALFEERCGYSLTDRLPALLGPMGEDTDWVRYNYWNVAVDAFIRSYDRQIQDWCHQNGLLYAAEKPVLRSSQLQYLDIPGCDTGHQKVYSVLNTASANYRGNPKILSSGAHFYGKSRALCECFHSIGWGMTIQDMKWIIDWLAIQGINVMTPHAYYYTTDSLAKHDAPPSSFFQQPYWADMSGLNAYVRNLCRTLTGGSRRVDILLVDPVTSTWTAMGEKADLKSRIADDFSAVQKALFRGHLDYYVVDPFLLAEFRAEGGRIHWKDEEFRVLVLPPMTNLEDAAAEAVRKLVVAGATVISVGCMPVESIGSVDVRTLFSELFGVDAGQVAEHYARADGSQLSPASPRPHAVFLGNAESLADTLEAVGARDFSVASGGEQNGDILGLHYRKEDGDYYFLANNSGKPAETLVTLRESGQPALYRVSLVDGVRQELDYESDEKRLMLPVRFSQFESVMLFADHAAAGRGRPEHAEVAEIVLDTSDEWEQAIEGLNALRLGRWELTVEAVEGERLPEPLRCGVVITEPVIDQLHDSRAPLPVKLAEHFGCPKEMVFPALRCLYVTRFDVKALPEGTLLVMEPGSIGGSWSLTINGRAVGPENFARREVFLPDNLAADISGLLHGGENEIVLTVDTRRTDDGLMNPLYICGKFGVSRPERTGLWELAPLPAKGTLAGAADCGLPFFAGCRKLRRTVELDGRGDVLFRLRDYLDCDSVTLFINGVRAVACSWEPYVFPVGLDLIRPGVNAVELRVRTTALGLFEGQRFDQVSHRSVDLD